MAGVYRRDLSRAECVVHSRSHSGISTVREFTRDRNGPFPLGSHLLRSHAVLRPRKSVEIQETAVVTASKYKSYTDPELVSMCLNGDALAWETLITRYRRLIYSLPVRFGFGPADAADVFQAVCLKLIEHLHQIKDETKISAWLVTTTTRQCLHLRSLKFRETDAGENFDEQPDPADNLEELRILTEQQQAIREAVDQLAERCRSLIEILYFDPRQLSYEDISAQMGIPVASIGPTRARCLDKLRTILRRGGIK